MRSGELRERVKFQRLSKGAGDGAGNYGTVFTDIPGATGISADIAPLKASEVVNSEGVQQRTQFDVVVRWRPALAGIRVDDIMIDERHGTTFNVKAPPLNPDKRRRRLKILVETGGPNG